MRFLYKVILIETVVLFLLGVGQRSVASAAIGGNDDSVTITNWSLSFVAAIGILQDSTATFGVRPDATTDYDPAYDIPRPPDPPGDYIMAYFPHTGGMWPSLLGWKFASDFTTPVNCQWWLVVESMIGSGPVTLSWDTSRIHSIMGDVTLWMRDSSADLDVNITAQQSYSFTYTGKRSFYIWSEARATYCNIYPRWNMTSLPRVPTEFEKSKLFPSAVSNAFSYEGAYRSCDTLNVGKGYWLKFDKEQMVGFTGSTISSYDIPVHAGWNMIGALTEETAVPMGGIITSQFYGYRDNYFAAETLKPGCGYWVKVSSDGSIPLGTNIDLPKPILTRMQLVYVISLTISDREGAEQTLYLIEDQQDMPTEMLELPPVPPADAFDARFTSQRYLERIDTRSTAPIIHKIRLQSVHYPLRIAVALNDPTLRVEIQTENQLLYNSQTVGESNSITIIDSNIHEITVAVSPVVDAPMKYELSQNYPNPFNPSTVIGYTLPEPSNVQMKIVNTLGQDVALLFRGYQDAGLRTIIIDGTLFPVSSGVYFYTIEAVGARTGVKFSQTKKLIYIK
jgi:hypothetical protein